MTVMEVMENFKKLKVEYIAMQNVITELQEKLEKKDKLMENFIQLYKNSRSKTVNQDQLLSDQESENLRLSQKLVEQSTLIEEYKRQVKSLQKQIDLLKQIQEEKDREYLRKKPEKKIETFSHPSFQDDNKCNTKRQKTSNSRWPNIQVWKRKNATIEKVDDNMNQPNKNKKRKLYSEDTENYMMFD